MTRQQLCSSNLPPISSEKLCRYTWSQYYLPLRCSGTSESVPPIVEVAQNRYMGTLQGCGYCAQGAYLIVCSVQISARLLYISAAPWATDGVSMIQTFQRTILALWNNILPTFAAHSPYQRFAAADGGLGLQLQGCKSIPNARKSPVLWNDEGLALLFSQKDLSFSYGSCSWMHV